MHYLSVLSIFKNETMNLKTWINHYLWQGVDHFYLIDNGSDDLPLNILQEYIDKGLVTYFYRPEKYQQIEHYKFVFDSENLKVATHWLAICDLDEFFYGVDQRLSLKMKSLEFYNVIYCNWLMYGSDNLINHPDDIRRAIVHREPNLHINTKYIFKTKSIISSSQINIHYLMKNNRYKLRIEKFRFANKLIRLNHYPIQSFEFFKKVKMTRGDVSSNSSDNLRDEKYFNNYNKNTTTRDSLLKDLIENTPVDY
jgi:hypothetical protein